MKEEPSEFNDDDYEYPKHPSCRCLYTSHESIMSVKTVVAVAKADQQSKRKPGPTL